MEELRYIKDEKGRIIKAVRGNYCAEIIWSDENVDIEFCNYIVEIVCTARGVGAKKWLI